MRKSSLLTSAAIAALIATNAFAQNETITVTGSLESDIPQMLAQTGTQVDIIGALSIKNGSYIDLSQTLSAEAPGLYIAPQHGPFDYVDASLLGSRTADILWLVDGVRINNRLYSFTTPLDSLPASMVERIEIVQGGQSLFYGTQAVAGAINIVTKSFSDSPDGALTLGGDSNYGTHLDGYFRDGFGRSEFVIYGSADISRGFRPYPIADFQPSSTQRTRGYHVYTAGGKYRFRAMDDLSFSASYEKNIAHLQYPAPQKVNTAYNQRNEDLATAKIDYTPSEEFQLFLKGYYHSWASRFTQFDNPPLGGPLIIIGDHDKWGFVDSGVNAMAKVGLIPGVSSILGYDYQTYNGSDAVLLITPQSEDVHAIFGQLIADDLLPSATLAAGFRYNIPSEGENAFIWNISGKYDITDAIYFKALVGSNFRLPTAEELFANDPGFERGNPNLRPERTISYNGTIGGRLDFAGLPLSWRVTGFYREIKDLIDYATFDALTGQDVFGNVAGKIITRGLETHFSAELSEDISAYADFTYAIVRQSGSANQMGRIPETVFKFGLDYHPNDLPFGANLSLQNIGELSDTISGGVGRVGYGNYTVVNIGGRIFLDTERKHRIGFSLNNVFDLEYASHLRRGTEDGTGISYLVHDRGMPRTFFLNYTWDVP